MVAVDVSDDRPLLDLMMADTGDAPEIYRPTNYWANYESRLLPFLHSHGLRDFRRQHRRGAGAIILNSFGAVDLAEPVGAMRRLDRSRLLNNRVTRRFPRVIETIHQAGDAVERWLSDDDLESFRRLCYEFARRQGELSAHAVPLEELSVSRVGNPEDVFEVDGRTYTRHLLYYYIRYAYVARFIDLQSTRTIVELGSGAGKQAEVIHKLHPDVTLLLFDIPPQLYVCHQYLSAVFPGDVVDYRATRVLPAIDALQPGRIYILGNWKFDLIADLPVDLFWNAASLQEMEPDVVAHYLRIVNGVAQSAYLMEMMAGKEIAPRPGRHGVLRPTTLEHYRQGLAALELRDTSDVLLPTADRMRGYSDSFWARPASRSVS
jgi:putative sugar O-methyltransferase